MKYAVYAENLDGERRFLDHINDAIAAIEDTPEWRTKIEKEMKAEKAGREYEAHRRK